MQQTKTFGAFLCINHTIGAINLVGRAYIIILRIDPYPCTTSSQFEHYLRQRSNQLSPAAQDNIICTIYNTNSYSSLCIVHTSPQCIPRYFRTRGCFLRFWVNGILQSTKTYVYTITTNAIHNVRFTHFVFVRDALLKHQQT